MMRRRDSALSLQRVYSLLVRYSRTPCLTATQLAGQRSKLLRVSDNGLAIPILIGAVGFIHLYLSQVRFESQFDLDLLWNFGFVHLYPSQVPFKSRFDLAHVRTARFEGGSDEFCKKAASNAISGSLRPSPKMPSFKAFLTAVTAQLYSSGWMSSR